VIGEGGMGVVYRARDRSRDRPVALKCLHLNLIGDQELRRRFVREARLLQAWAHPGVVAVYDLIEHHDVLAIVMELIDGHTLARHLEVWRGVVPLVEIRELFGAILLAMQEAHERGIVHRDLKPQNVLVRSSAHGSLEPKVVDFGIAKILEGTSYTVTGVFLGTCRYMSPEQVKTPQSADHRSDIYSLGVTLYQLCTGQVPFDYPNHFALMMAHVNEPPSPPRRHRPDLPDALERLILDALAKDPVDRPQSCAEFRQRLEAAIPAPPAAPKGHAAAALPKVVREADGSELVLVPAGPFKLGPSRREVYLDAFYLDRTPVTNLAFLRFLEVTGYRPQDGEEGRFLAHWKGGHIPPGLEHHPVVYVSAADADRYAAWAGKRLPTEAEWEKAARGTDGRRYPWGREEPDAARALFGQHRHGTAAVDAHPQGASPYGILDLAGNVFEWCEDLDDPAFYASGPARNPRSTRVEGRPLRVMRGGSFMVGPASLRTYSRTSFEATTRFASGGFRCARTAG
jgi:serine/threonine-protein kinase